jgi:uncharacterized membrane protein YphA (DoxX/SURF4 family)
MSYLTLICRLLTGSLFIFSGLIKLNDPYGTAYKLEEYFEVFASDISPLFLKFIPLSLFISILISAFEVILGAAILLYYKMKYTTWIALLLILFFTFLTFYSYTFDKVKECGCFGTMIPLSPKQSFIKDLFLLTLILILFFNRKKLDDGYNNLKGHILMGFLSIFTFLIGINATFSLPYIDPTPYRVGVNINSLIKPKEKPRYQWVMEKDGKEYYFDDKHYPADTSYKFKCYILLTDSSLLIPQIAGFRIYNEEEDFTEEALKGKKIFIIIANVGDAWENCQSKCFEKINLTIQYLEKEGYYPVILTIPSEEFEDFRHEMQLRGDYYYADDTVLKTMIRSNPGLIIVKDGLIQAKWHYRNIPDSARIKEVIR